MQVYIQTKGWEFIVLKEENLKFKICKKYKILTVPLGSCLLNKSPLLISETLTANVCVVNSEAGFSFCSCFTGYSYPLSS